MGMRILDRLATGQPEKREEGSKFDALLRRLHQQVIDRIDVTTLAALSGDKLRTRLRETVEHLLETEGENLTPKDREIVITGLLNEITGLGPLETIMADPTVSTRFWTSAFGVAKA